MGFWKSSEQAKHTGSQAQSGQGAEPGGRGIPAWLCGVLAGIVLLGIGVYQGQLAVIWRKAVMVCLECIGIG